MKTTFLALLAFLTIRADAQSTRAIKTNNSIQPALNEVMEAYFKHFPSSLGDRESESEKVTTYSSKVGVPGALSCNILKYDVPGTYSWTAVMAEAEDFQVAARKYKQYFKEINNQNFTPFGGIKYLLTGKLDEAEESRSFASTLLQLNGNEKELKDFYINLEMQYELPNWVVKISMYSKIPDNEIRPGMKSISGE